MPDVYLSVTSAIWRNNKEQSTIEQKQFVTSWELEETATAGEQLAQMSKYRTYIKTTQLLHTHTHDTITLAVSRTSQRWSERPSRRPSWNCCRRRRPTRPSRCFKRETTRRWCRRFVTRAQFTYHQIHGPTRFQLDVSS